MSELESILNYLETTSMEPHDDYTSEFSYKEQKVLWKYIKQLQQENKKYKEVIDKALDIALQYGQTDGAHHKAWVIDQIVRVLAGDDYKKIINEYVFDGKDPVEAVIEDEFYVWDTGIAP